MFHAVLSFPQLVVEYALLSYTILFIGILLEGEVVLLIAGILAHLGALNIPFIFLVTVAGAYLKTYTGYRIGGYIARKFPENRFFCAVERRVALFAPRFEERPFWSMFTARFFTLGMHFFTLVYTGYQGVSFRKILKAETASLFVWAPIMIAIGYVFSFAALSVTHDIRKFLIIILGLMVAFFLLEKLLRVIYEFNRVRKGS